MWRAGSSGRVLGGVLVALCCLGASVPIAAADGGGVHVQVTQDSCPSAGLLRSQLAPLLDGEPLTVDADDAAASNAQHVARVFDAGAGYAIEIDGKRRELSDAARNCVERARVAAVFIALNLGANASANGAAATPAAGADDTAAAGNATSTNATANATATDAAPKTSTEKTITLPVAPKASSGKQAAVQPSAGDEDGDVIEPDDSEPSESTRLTLHALVFGSFGYATEPGSASAGAGGGIAIASGALQLSLRAGGLVATQLALESAATHGSVALTRVPLSLSLGYAFRFGRWFSIGPALGFELDLLRLRGQGFAGSATGLRADPGALLVLDAGLRLTESLGLGLRLGMCAFPQAYDLLVENAGKLGKTPRLWLDASLGIDWKFH